MHVRVMLFAMLRELKGASELELDVEPGTTVAGLQRRVLADLGENGVPGRLLYAVNQNYVTPDHELHDGDEVAFIPPVSGG